MSSESASRRARETVEILVAEGTEASPVQESDLWIKVQERFPLSEREASKDSRKRTRGYVEWRFSTLELARAGWLHRDPSRTGKWFPTAAGQAALLKYPDPVEFVRAGRTLYNDWKRNVSDQQRVLSAAILPQGEEQALIRNVGALYLEHGLQRGESIFSPGRQIWTKEGVAELVENFVEAPDEQAESFVAKLRLQLNNVTDDARLLMAELVCLQLLPTMTVGATAKKLRVDEVLSTMDHPVQIPDAVIDAFGGGSFNPGPAMGTRVYDALCIIIRFVESWIELDFEEQEAILSDPISMRDLVYRVSGHSFPTQRNALCYVLRPDYFGPLVSNTHKHQIRAAFLGEIRESTGDIDIDLYNITIALQQKVNGPINFYDAEYEKHWKPRVVSEDAEIEDDDLVGESVPSRNSFPPASPELASSLHVDRDWLQDKLDLIERRKQVILYGPPGTGKTYVARAMARHIAEDDAAVTLVQFHPSYSYEDFFEGFRPATVNGNLSYELKSGPLKRIAEQARRDPERNFVLIIDEINRGNLAKIFGELYFLLEYRDAEVGLLYSQDSSFTLPPNITIIGTMNTSDRSIALMDAAMRRRFAFIELHPQKQPTASVLRRWLGHHKLDSEAADLLDALNAQIESDFAVGPSYLMSSDLDVSESRLADVWKHEILPLLEEHHYGDGIDIEKRYGLKALRSGLKPAEGENEAPETTAGE